MLHGHQNVGEAVDGEPELESKNCQNMQINVNSRCAPYRSEYKVVNYYRWQKKKKSREEKRC